MRCSSIALAVICLHRRRTSCSLNKLHIYPSKDIQPDTAFRPTFSPIAVESRRQRVDRINGEIKVGIEENFEFDSCPPNYELDNGIVDIDLLFHYGADCCTRTANPSNVTGFLLFSHESQTKSVISFFLQVKTAVPSEISLSCQMEIKSDLP